MALIDDARAARLRRRQAHRDTDAELAAVMEQLVQQVADALFSRLRPLPVLSWASDDDLRAANLAWARAAVDAATRPADDTDPPPIQ